MEYLKNNEVDDVKKTLSRFLYFFDSVFHHLI